jgi:hypothetical protein
MRYVIVDLEGASRDYFGRRSDVRDALLEHEQERPGAAQELFVAKYDDMSGERIGELERGDEVLASTVLDSSAATSFVASASSIAWAVRGTATLVKRAAVPPEPKLARAARPTKTDSGVPA